MTGTFDPYYKWLGIPPQEQPPNCYRLLGLQLYEADSDAIESAVEGRMALLRSRQHGPHGVASQRLLNEVAQAKACLLDPSAKTRYDQWLQSMAAQADVPPITGGATVMPAAPPAPPPAGPPPTGPNAAAPPTNPPREQTPAAPWAGVGAANVDPSPRTIVRRRRVRSFTDLLLSPLFLGLFVAAALLAIAAVFFSKVWAVN